MRDLFCNAMIALFARQPFVFLTGDLGFKALEPLKSAIGDHFINAGVAEQNMVSVAAGIAKTGLPAWVYSIAPFAYARPFEQIRNDVCLHNLPVTIVGNGGGYGYGVMGGTHHAIEDYGSMLCLQNMHVFAPSFGPDVAASIDRITALKRPSYLRLGYAEKIEGLDIAPYAPWRKILNGTKGMVITTGAIAGSLVKSLKDEPEDSRPSLWVVSELPLDDLPKEVIHEIVTVPVVCVVEEHVAQGGLGQMLATTMLEHRIVPRKFNHLHAEGYVSGFYGSQTFHRNESGLNKENIIRLLHE